MSSRILRPTDQGLARRHRGRTTELEQRFEVDTIGRPIPTVGGGSRSSEAVVASSVSSPLAIAGADYKCSGTADDVVIQQAIDENATYGGVVRLMAGVYYLDAVLDLPGGMILTGQGRGTYVYTNGTNCIDVDGHDSCVYDMSLIPDLDYAITHSSGSHLMISGIETGGWIGLKTRDMMVESTMGLILFMDDESIVTGCLTEAVYMDNNSSFNRMSGCTTWNIVVGEAVNLFGTDNVIDNCHFLARAGSDNNGRMVLIDGTRNNFTNNIVRGNNPTLRHAYAIDILATATGIRVTDDDLRPGNGSSWGTAPVRDLGAGSILRDNDS